MDRNEHQNKPSSRKGKRKHLLPVKREKRKLTSKLHGKPLETRTPVNIPVVQVVLEFRALIAKLTQKVENQQSELLFYLYNSATKETLTEAYRVTVGASGLIEDLSKLGSTKTVFRDLTLDEYNSENVYLLCRITRFVPHEGERKWEHCRTPLCWAVSPPLNLLHTRNTEYSWPLFQCSQGYLFENIPAGAIQNVASVTTMEHAILAVSCAVHKGDYQTLISRYPDLK